MNKIYLLLLSILFLIIEVGDLSASNQNAFGPPYDEIKDIEVEDLEPEECISYDEFVKEDYLDQQKYSGIWSTILHNKLDKLDIKIRSSSTLKGYPVTNLFDKNRRLYYDIFFIPFYIFIFAHNICGLLYIKKI